MHAYHKGEWKKQKSLFWLTLWTMSYHYNSKFNDMVCIIKILYSEMHWLDCIYLLLEFWTRFINMIFIYFVLDVAKSNLKKINYYWGWNKTKQVKLIQNILLLFRLTSWLTKEKTGYPIYKPHFVGSPTWLGCGKSYGKYILECLIPIHTVNYTYINNLDPRGQVFNCWS